MTCSPHHPPGARPPLPPPDRALPHLGAAFDADALTAAVAAAWPSDAAGGSVERFAPTWIRYKPGASCIVGGALTVRADAPSTTWATVTLYADGRDAAVVRAGGRLARLSELAHALHGGPAIRHAHVADLSAVLQLAPVDRKLPWLTEASAPAVMARTLGLEASMTAAPTVECVRHVPERKGVLCVAWPGNDAGVRSLPYGVGAAEICAADIPAAGADRRVFRPAPAAADLRVAFAKVNARRDAVSLAQLQRDLLASGLPVGRLLATDAPRHLTIVAAVPGRPLRALRDDDTETVTAWAAAATATVGRLHALPATSRAAGGLGRRTAIGEAAAVLGAAVYVDGLRSGGFGATETARRIAAALGEAPWRARVIHGDWYDRQVLVGSAGDHLIDFDDAAIGEPALDFGTFVAHFTAWSAADARAGGAASAARAAATTRAVRDAVLTVVGARDATAARLLALHEAAALVRLAVHPFRRLDADWPAAIAAIVAAAQARLTCAATTRHLPAARSVGPTPMTGAGAATGSDTGGTSIRPAADPVDPSLPTLALAVDRHVISAALTAFGRVEAQVVTAAVVRHKPGRRCLVQYGVVDGAAAERVGRAYGADDADRPGRAGPTDGDGAADPSSAHRAAGPVALVYGKLFASARGERVLASHVHLHAARTADGPRLPEPIGYARDARVVLLGHVPGVPVTARLCAGDIALATRIGLALAALHRATAPLDRTHWPTDELAPLAARVARLAAADDRLGARATGAYDALAATAPTGRDWRLRPVHRDLHPEQVLVDPGGRIGFVDLDDAALSEPALDVGNFMAHLVWLSCRAPAAASRLRRAAHAFIRAHARAAPGHDHAVLRWCEAAALLRLADVHLASGGIPMASALVTACLARLVVAERRAPRGG